jgi:hypothetical protein
MFPIKTSRGAKQRSESGDCGAKKLACEKSAPWLQFPGTAQWNKNFISCFLDRNLQPAESAPAKKRAFRESKKNPEARGII